ncbi:MAG: hypothetical protein ACYS8K_03050 [Planctomycetota bacterium]|jgi:hypothetical protein
MRPERPPDIRVCGRQEEVDSFAACLQAALTHWGRNVAYECVSALSGAAFSPAWAEDETCAGRWVEHGADGRIEFLGHALGFSMERSPDASEAKRDLDDFNRRATEAAASGGAVLCGTRPCWTIAARWHTDLSQVPLSGPDGLAERHKRLSPRAPLYILRPAERTLTRCEAIREALRFGATVAAGSHRPDGLAYGGRLYDAWLAQLEKEHFCPQCGPNGWRCAERVASRARSSQLSAVTFLRRAGAFVGALCGDRWLSEAQAAYGTMALKLDPYTAGNGMDEVLAEPRLREQYAQDLGEVRRLHQTAANILSLLACAL